MSDWLKRFQRSMEASPESLGKPSLVGGPAERLSHADKDRSTDFHGSLFGFGDAFETRLLETPHGRVRVIDHRVFGGPGPGRPPPGEILSDHVTSRARFLKDPRLAGFCRDGALFLDVEATGLSHGAGTVAFLIGLGLFDKDGFIVRQLLMEDYDQEQAQLHTFLKDLDRCRFLVTYNGKSFDKSILENRLVIQRFLAQREARLRLVPHMDLLHIGRSLFRGVVDRFTLSSVESSVLKFDRGPDLPGALVPQMYFQFLSSRDPEFLQPVLRHNFHDVLSLAYLAHGYLDCLSPERMPDHPQVRYNVARLFFSSGHPALAAGHLRGCLSEATGELAVSAAGLLSKVYRRANEPAAALVGVWEQTAMLARESPVPHRELSKLHEWKTGDLPEALRQAEIAWQYSGEEPPEDDPRQARLSAKLGRIRQAEKKSSLGRQEGR